MPISTQGIPSHVTEVQRRGFSFSHFYILG